MNYRRLILMVSLLGLVVPGAIAGETDIDKKRAAGAKINDRVVLFSATRDMVMDKITAWRMKSAYEGQTVRAKEIKK